MQPRHIVYAQLHSPLGFVGSDCLNPSEMEKAKQAVPNGRPIPMDGIHYRYAWGISCGCATMFQRRRESEYYDPKKGKTIRRRRL